MGESSSRRVTPDNPPNEARLSVSVQPRAGRNQLAGLQNDIWRVRVKAPPESGQANSAVVSLLASLLGVGRSAVTITRGRTSKRKTVTVKSLTQQEAEQRLHAVGS